MNLKYTSLARAILTTQDGVHFTDGLCVLRGVSFVKVIVKQKLMPCLKETVEAIDICLKLITYYTQDKKANSKMRWPIAVTMQ